MRRKTMVLAGVHCFVLVLCHIVLCSHSLRHHRGHSSSPVLSASASLSGGNMGDGSSDETEDQLADSSSVFLSSMGDSEDTGNGNEGPGGMVGDRNSKGAGVTSTASASPGAKSNSAVPLIPQLKVKPGHELKLKCDLNNTYGRIMWLLNAKPIRTDNGRYSIQGPSLNRAIEGRLTINNVLPEDNGVWQCHETKFDGKEHVSKPIWVVVLAAPRAVHLEFDGRRLSPSASPSNRVTYREKDNISIQCVAEGGNPPPRISWFLNSRNVTNSSHLVSDYLEDDKVYLTRSSLKIDNVTRTDHNKSVVCVVDHELLPASSATEASYLRATAYFNIEYPPSFIISRIPGFGYPIREGIAMALKCDIDANPWSRPVWVKDGSEPPVVSTDDGFLNFSVVQRNQTGWYKCTSVHPMGTFSSVGYYLNVRYEPTIVLEPPSRVDAVVGEKVALKCEADGRPSPALCWSRIGYGGSLTSVGSGQELILDKILYQEAGSYRCVAQNRLGLEERRAETHDVQVVVTGRPVVYPTNRTIMGFAGQPLSISVEVCANPVPERSYWVFGTIALRPGSKYKNKYVAIKLTVSESPNCYLAVLTILNVSAEDGGEYMFFVKNSRGIHEGTILLNITQASYSVSSSRAYGPTPPLPFILMSTLFSFSFTTGITMTMMSASWIWIAREFFHLPLITLGSTLLGAALHLFDKIRLRLQSLPELLGFFSNYINKMDEC